MSYDKQSNYMASAIDSPSQFLLNHSYRIIFYVLGLPRRNWFDCYSSRLLLNIWLPSEERAKVSCVCRQTGWLMLRLLVELLGSSCWFCAWGALLLLSEELDELFWALCCVAFVWCPSHLFIVIWHLLDWFARSGVGGLVAFDWVGEGLEWDSLSESSDK